MDFPPLADPTSADDNNQYYHSLFSAWIWVEEPERLMYLPHPSLPIVSSIDTLPPELLSRVFQEVQEEEQEEDEWGEADLRLTTQWLAVTRVCSYWRDVAYATPLLWRTVDIDRSLEWLQRCLILSGTVPLRLRLHNPSRMAAASRLLIEHAGRIQRLRVSGRETIESLNKLEPLFSITLPILEELHLNVDVENASSSMSSFDLVLPHLLDVDPGRLPAIRTLKVVGVGLPWTFPLPRHLHTLELKWTLASTRRFPLSDLLDALEACPSLEHIVLYKAMPYGFEWDNQHVRSDRLISWPNLRSLVIAGAGREAEEEEDDEVDEIRPVLEHIRVPESCDFFLEIVNAKASPYGDCLPNDPSCIRHLEKAIEATWGDPSCFECRCPASTTSDQRGVSLTEPELKGRLRVDIDPVGMWCWLDKETTDQEDRALAEFRHYLGRAPLRTLTLACGPSLRGFLEVLRAFPALTELALDCKRSGRVPQRDAICEFLSALAGGKMASEAWSSAAVPKLRSGKGGVPMTNLRVLRLDYVLWYDEMADDIERCLWSRVVGGAENLDDVRIHFNGVVKDEEESGEDGQALEKEFEEDGQALPKGGSRLKVLKHLVNGLVVVSDFDREWEL